MKPQLGETCNVRIASLGGVVKPMVCVNQIEGVGMEFQPNAEFDLYPPRVSKVVIKDEDVDRVVSSFNETML